MWWKIIVILRKYDKTSHNMRNIKYKYRECLNKMTITKNRKNDNKGWNRNVKKILTL